MSHSCLRPPLQTQLLAVLVVGVGWLHSTPVYAQVTDLNEAAVTETPVVQINQIVSDPALSVATASGDQPVESLTDAINAQTTAYRAALEDYRTVERTYTVAKGQFKQLATLAALETAITATQEAMAARDTVILEYFKLVDLQLQNAQGIAEDDRNMAISQIATQQQLISQHLQRVEQLTSRTEINVLANDFAALAPNLESATYISLSLLASGRLQAAHDKASVFAAASADRVAQADQTVSTASQERAITEVNRVLNETQSQLDDVTSDVTSSRAKASRASFTAILKKLAPVYTGLSQVINYLNELNSTVEPAP